MKTFENNSELGILFELLVNLNLLDLSIAMLAQTTLSMCEILMCGTSQ